MPRIRKKWVWLTMQSKNMLSKQLKSLTKRHSQAQTMAQWLCSNSKVKTDYPKEAVTSKKLIYSWEVCPAMSLKKKLDKCLLSAGTLRAVLSRILCSSTIHSSIAHTLFSKFYPWHRSPMSTLTLKQQQLKHSQSLEWAQLKSAITRPSTIWFQELTRLQIREWSTTLITECSISPNSIEDYPKRNW